MADSWHRQSLLSGTTQDAGFISANTAERRWLGGKLSPLSRQTPNQECCRRACVSGAGCRKGPFIFLTVSAHLPLAVEMAQRGRIGGAASRGGGRVRAARPERQTTAVCQHPQSFLYSTVLDEAATVPSQRDDGTVGCRLVRASISKMNSTRADTAASIRNIFIKHVGAVCHKTFTLWGQEVIGQYKKNPVKPGTG